MERAVQIHDLKPLRDGFTVFLDLPDLLPVFDPEGHAWQWSIREWPELVSDERWDFNPAFIEREIDNSRRGFRMTFEELRIFGGQVRQVIWGEFLAGESLTHLPSRSASPREVGRVATAGLAAIDSTYWCLGGPAALVESAVERFESVVEIDPGDWPAVE